MPDLDDCPDTVGRTHSTPDVDGRCLWCRRKFRAKAPRPRGLPTTHDLTDAYRRQWDPDWGTANTDTDPW